MQELMRQVVATLHQMWQWRWTGIALAWVVISAIERVRASGAFDAVHQGEPEPPGGDGLAVDAFEPGRVAAPEEVEQLACVVVDVGAAFDESEPLGAVRQRQAEVSGPSVRRGVFGPVDADDTRRRGWRTSGLSFSMDLSRCDGAPDWNR